MGYVLVRPALFAVIALSLPLLASCSGLFGNPREQANDYVAEANRAIDEHNRLFEEARSTYAEAKETIEAGEDTSKEAGRIAQTRETMQEARDKLEEAREPLSEVQDLNVGSEIREYAGLLSDALDAQLAAEAKEIEFYEILEQDPVLSKNREEALAVLAEAGDGYKKAGDNYARAQELADANPKLLNKS
jgi:vacuolar-type H+-ATPase subunit I/STV1